MEIVELKKFDRIVAMLIQLQSRRVVKAQDLADRFGVSLRTIYRDIRTLESSGVPVVGEAGVGYSIMEGYRLPPVMFTREEAGSFVAAEKLMQHYVDKSLRTHYASAMFKIKAVLRGSEKDWVSTLESQVSINPGRPSFNADIPNTLEVLFKAMAEKKQLELKYKTFDAEADTLRNIEPVGIFHEHNNWYVMAYCHLREDYRQFRADRIKGIKISELDFTQEHGPVEDHRNAGNFQKKLKVRLLVDARITKYISESRHYFGFVSEETKGNQVEMIFQTDEGKAGEEGFARWFMMFGDQAKILEPEQLKIRVGQLVVEMGAKNQEPRIKIQDSITKNFEI